MAQNSFGNSIENPLDKFNTKNFLPQGLDTGSALDLFGKPQGFGSQVPSFGNNNSAFQNTFGSANQLQNGFSGQIGGLNNIANTSTKGGGFGEAFRNFAGTPKNPGIGRDLFGLAGGIANTALSLKQFGLVKKNLKQNKRQFNQQFDAQRRLANGQIADRQRARIAVRAPGAARSVEEVLAEQGIQ